MARLVRCPNCHKLLVEYPNVPVYQCGGCGIVLRAKNHNATREDTAPASPQINHPESQSDHGFSDSGSISSVRETTPSPSIMQSPKVENGGEENMLPGTGFPCSDAEHKQHHEKGECSEHAVEEGGTGAASGLPFSSGGIDFEAQNQQVELVREDGRCELNEQVENTQKLSEADCLNLTTEVEQSSCSAGHSIASEEDMGDRGQFEGLHDVVKSPATISSHAYDGSISSSDDARSVRTPDRHLAESRRTFKTTYTESKLKTRSLASNSSNERIGSGVMTSFNAIRDDISSKCESDELGGGSSFDSEEFQSVQNWRALQKDGASGILPRGSFKGDLHDKVELLRKIDEVRDHLAKICVASEDMQQLEQRSRANLFDQPAQASYVPVRNASQKYPLQMKHFSGHAYCSCLHCLEERRLHMMPNLHGHRSNRANAHDLNSHSSSSGSLHKHDHDLEKSHSKGKPKRHCRPISRAAPFVICNKCTKLLQLPADFLISRRKMYKLQCGACNEVLSLLFPAKARNPSELVHSSIEVDDRIDGKTGSPSQYSCVPHFSRNSSEGRDAKATAAALRLHQLMGYLSASDLLYQHGHSERGYESTESMARHTYRPLEESRASNAFKGRGSNSPYHHEHIVNAISPDSVAMHEEGESSKRSTRPGLPRPGMLK